MSIGGFVSVGSMYTVSAGKSPRSSVRSHRPGEFEFYTMFYLKKNVNHLSERKWRERESAKKKEKLVTDAPAMIQYGFAGTILFKNQQIALNK